MSNNKDIKPVIQLIEEIIKDYIKKSYIKDNISNSSYSYGDSGKSEIS